MLHAPACVALLRPTVPCRRTLFRQAWQRLAQGDAWESLARERGCLSDADLHSALAATLVGAAARSCYSTDSRQLGFSRGGRCARGHGCAQARVSSTRLPCDAGCQAPPAGLHGRRFVQTGPGLPAGGVVTPQRRQLLSWCCQRPTEPRATCSMASAFPVEQAMEVLLSSTQDLSSGAQQAIVEAMQQGARAVWI